MNLWNGFTKRFELSVASTKMHEPVGILPELFKFEPGSNMNSFSVTISTQKKKVVASTWALNTVV